MEVDGSGAAPFGGGTGTSAQQHLLSISSSLEHCRPNAAPARGRPNMMGQTRPGAGPVRRPGDVGVLCPGGPSAGPLGVDLLQKVSSVQLGGLGQQDGMVATLQPVGLGQVTRPVLVETVQLISEAAAGLQQFVGANACSVGFDHHDAAASSLDRDRGVSS
jgi:hypothetical protein